MAVGQERASPTRIPADHRWRSRLRLERVIFLLVIAAGAAYHFGAFPGGKQAYLIAIDGRPAVVVASRGLANRVLDDLKARAEHPASAGFAQKVTLHPVSAKDHRVAAEAEAMEVLASRLTVVVPGAGIYANGKLVAGVPDREEAVRALSLLLRELSPPDADLNRAFKERISVRETQVPADQMLSSAERVVEKVREAMAAKETYTVTQGDTGWGIATRFKADLEQLKRANPRIDLQRLHLGDRLAIPGGGPPVTVVAWKELAEPIGDPAKNLTQTVHVTYENGARVQQYVVRRPARRDTTRRSSRSRRHVSRRHSEEQPVEP